VTPSTRFAPRDWTGETIGSAVVEKRIGRVQRSGGTRTLWLVRCRCGAELHRHSAQLNDTRRKGGSMYCPTCLAEAARARKTGVPHPRATSAHKFDVPGVVSRLRAERAQLWLAINEYAKTCGGDPASHVYGNTKRQNAVSMVEGAVAIIAQHVVNQLPRGAP
jgi:hypothetical protein